MDVLKWGFKIGQSWLSDVTVIHWMFMSPPNSSTEALTSSVAASGHVISKEVITVKQDDKGGTLTW